MSPPTPPDPLFLPKFDLWCHQRGLTLRQVAEALGCSAEQVRRIRKPFGHADRRIPKPELMNRIVAWTGGEVQPTSFYPSAEVLALIAERVAA